MSDISEAVDITDSMILDAQRFVNQQFGDDAMAPIYLIREPAADDIVAMSIASGNESFHYRNIINGWQGGGYLLRVHSKKLHPVAFRTLVLHEVSHIFQSLLPFPTSKIPEGFEHEFRFDVKPSPVKFGTDYWIYRTHKADFWRLAFHVLKRAKLAGYDCSHRFLGISWVSLDDMLSAIEPETEELLDRPLWKIGRRPVPRIFARLFDPGDWNNIESVSQISSTPEPMEAHADHQETAEAERQSA